MRCHPDTDTNTAVTSFRRKPESTIAPSGRRPNSPDSEKDPVSWRNHWTGLNRTTAMPPLEIILLLIRWAHALAAVFWIGGSLFLLLAARPALRRAEHPAAAILARALAAEFRPLVRTAIAVLLITGVILTAHRITSDAASVPYAIALAAKIALSLYAFAIAWTMPPSRSGPDESQRRNPHESRHPATAQRPKSARLRSALLGPTTLTIIGITVIGIADLLAWLFERALAG